MGGTNHFLTEVIPQVHPLEAPKTNIENVENRPLEKEIHFVGKHWLGYRSMILIYIYIIIYVYILYRLERQRERERDVPSSGLFVQELIIPKEISPKKTPQGLQGLPGSCPRETSEV